MSAELIHQMYIAYYQRPADPAGLIYWQNQLNANGGGEAGWNAVAAAFANAAESSALYGSQTLAQKISAIYLASFERAASADEIAYWEASGFNAAQIGFAIVNGAQNDDLSTVTKKVDYAEAFVAQIDPAGTGVGPFAFQYVDPSQGRSLMDVITKDSDVSAATVASQVSSTLPTLRSVSLTSDKDTITPQANAAEEISAALGGTAPTLGRTDEIDGGSAQDTINVDMNGSFLLGFSSGYMRDVEIVNLAATQSSVVAKTFNFTGISGVETINVGAANAVINLSNINDTSPTVNLSGQTTGTFEIGFASGLISGAGSAMTVGFTETGSIGSEVSLIANGITDLTVNSFGTQNAVNLGNAQNDLTTISFGGSGNLYVSDIPSTVSGVEASGFGGDLTLTVDTDTNTGLLASGQTVTGGAGNDALRIMGSGIAAASTTSIEELIFDSSSSEAIVRATGMAGLNTLTFSGQGDNAPSISGLGDQALTVNAILGTAGNQVTISGTGVLTVNLNSDPTNNVAAQVMGANAFDFKAHTSGNISINVGPYTSASGTYNLNNADNDVNVVVDSTSVFSSNIKASGAQTVNITGSGKIDTEAGGGISAQDATSISLSASSGDVVVSSSAIQTFSLTTADDFTVTGRVTGASTVNVTTGGTADLSGLYHEGLTNATFAGSGAGVFGTHSGSGINTVFTLTGLGGGGFSASEIHNKSGDVTIAAENMSGSLVVNTISASGVTISGPTNGQATFSSVESVSFTFDGSASTGGSGSLTMQNLDVSANASISLGSNASGATDISAAEASQNFVLDASNYGGTLDFESISASGNVTISMGTAGDFSGTTIVASNNFTLDGSKAATGQVAITTVSAGGNSTISMGSGTGSLAVTTAIAAGNITLDAGNFGGTIDMANISASGNLTISVGSKGDFSGLDIRTDSNFTLDASNATTGSITIGGLSALGNASIVMGTGTGGVALTGANSGDIGGTFTLDGSNFGGTIDLDTISGSGVITVSLGSIGDLSGAQMHSLGGVTIDGAAALSGAVTLGAISSDGAVNVVMGQGTGSIALTTGISTKAIVMDNSTFGGSVDVVDLSASGVTVSLGTLGDFSAAQIVSNAGFTLDGGAATSGSVTIGNLVATGNATLSMGGGSGSFAITASAVGNKNVTIETSNFLGTVDVKDVSASGAITVSLGAAGDFSAGNIQSHAGNFTLDASKATTGSITLTAVSASGNSTISMGGGSGALAITAANQKGSFTLDATNHKGGQTITAITGSGAITVSVGGDKGDFSAGEMHSLGNITIDMSAATQGDLNIQRVSGNNVSIVMGTGTGDVIIASAISNGTFTLDATNYQDIVTLDMMSSSGAITLNLNSENFTASSIVTSGGLTIAGHSSGDLTIAGAGISAGGAVSIVHSGTGEVAISAVETQKSFTLDLTASTSVADGGNQIGFISGSGVTVSLGTGNHFSAVDIGSNGGAGAVTINGGTGSGDVVVQTLSAGGAITITEKGSGTTTISSINTANTLTIDASNMAAGNSELDFNDISSSGAMTLTFGDAANLEVSAVDTAGTFTLNAANAVSANIVSTGMISGGTVIMNLGAASGDLTVTGIASHNSITISGAGSKLAMNIESLSASGNISVSLGPVTTDGEGANISAISTVGGLVTVDGSAYREKFDFDKISASGVSITMGDLADEIDGSAIVANTLTINGGDGSNFSANITSIDINGASGWSILMPELGDATTIASMAFSGGGIFKGTHEIDNISANSTSAAADSVTLDFDFREDSVTDVLDYVNGAGKEYLILRNFDGGEDDLDLTNTYGSAGGLDTSVGVTAAASLIGAALGTTVSTGDVATASGITAVFTYNGDTWLLGDGGPGDADGTWSAGEAIIRFVGTDDLVAGDIAFNVG